jgi:hypothetical protein
MKLEYCFVKSRSSDERYVAKQSGVGTILRVVCLRTARNYQSQLDREQDEYPESDRRKRVSMAPESLEADTPSLPR